MRKQSIYEGNLQIHTVEDAKKYKHLTKVTGYLSIYSSAKLDAPKLESVGGYLYIYSGAKLDALKSVGGDLSINSNAKLDAPKLESVGGYLYINSNAKLDAPKLESVGGYLSIYSSAKLDAPKLESVGGYLYIYSGAKLDALKSVGGYLSINSSAKLDAPKLESVGGCLYINSNAKLDAPKLESVGGYLYIYKDASLTANKLYTGGYSKFKVYDGIPCVALSSKQSNGITILSCRKARIKDQKVVGDKFYIAQQNEHNAHGKTIQEAVNELAFKTGKRDVSQFKNMPIDTKKTPDEWAFVYRMVTGACQYGVQDFMKRKGKLKKQYTLKQIIAETKGAFGHKQFVSVVEAA